MRYRFAMSVEFLTKNWALVAASVLGTGILLFVLVRAFQDSSRGRLNAAVSMLKKREKEARAARRAVDKATARLDRLRAKAASVKPRLAQEASESLEDARALLKIGDDQVLVARNHVRKVIVEDYPPKRHEKMRSKYLGPETSFIHPRR
jgi:hypothetical protein